MALGDSNWKSRQYDSDELNAWAEISSEVSFDKRKCVKLILSRSFFTFTDVRKYLKPYLVNSKFYFLYGIFILYLPVASIARFHHSDLVVPQRFS